MDGCVASFVFVTVGRTSNGLSADFMVEWRPAAREQDDDDDRMVADATEEEGPPTGRVGRAAATFYRGAVECIVLVLSVKLG